MAYADPGNAGLTSFGTTDGSTVPHIAGTPAKYLHAPAFASETDGYHLSFFANSGPNTGTNSLLNQYTILLTCWNRVRWTGRHCSTPIPTT